MRISVIGLGRLGSPLAAVIASRGHTVVGADVNRGTVDRVNAHLAPVEEPGLAALLEAQGDRITATTDVAAAASQSEISFVVVPTPSGEDGSFSNEMVLQSVAAIGEGIRARRGRRHVVVITSTVMPGSTQGPIRHALEEASGLTVGDGIGLCYSPEFIALGSVIHDITHADLVLIGESDRASGDVVAELLTSLVEGSPPVMRMNLVNAEVAKLAVNTFVTTKISFANMLAEICERLPEADAEVVTAAVGLDSRIGPKYLRPATAFGGPCFPRDNRALSRLARTAHVRADIAEATQAINDRQAGRLLLAVTAVLPERGRVAVLGLAYKPGTPVADASAGADLAAALAAAGHAVSVYDPAAMTEVRRRLGGAVSYAAGMAEAVADAAVIVIATPWPEFGQLGSVLPPARSSKPVIVDCWRLLGENALDERADIVYLGTGGPGPSLAHSAPGRGAPPA